jgi:iron(III) transport system substrate-binding protein
VDFYHFLEENYGPGFLTKLAAQQPRIYPSVQPITAALISGEIAAGIFLEPLTDEKNSGAPVDWGRLSGKIWGTRFYAVNLKAGPHPNAGLVLANFMVTKEGQEAVARNAASVLQDVSTAVGTTKNMRQQDPTKLTPQKVREFRSEFQQMFGQ